MLEDSGSKSRWGIVARQGTLQRQAVRTAPPCLSLWHILNHAPPGQAGPNAAAQRSLRLLGRLAAMGGAALATGIATWSVLALRQEKDQSERLRELDEMKDSILSSVSHELRTPIAVCRGHLDVLEYGADAGEVQAVMDILISELGLMARLVEDLTTLARVDDGTRLRREPLSLRGFADSIARQAEPLLGGRLQVASAGLDGTLRADPQRLSQALLNLLRNAADHAGGLEPVLFRVAADQAFCRFEVADEGGGVPRGEEEAVFEPFRTASTVTGGTGLGLFIVRGIARAHGGEAGVDNRPGQGATFWIRIPR